jgi:hypothetical protein
MEFILPKDKSENILRERRYLLKTHQPSIRQISRVLGLLEFTRPAIWSAPLHYRDIQLVQIESLHQTSDYNTQVHLSKKAKLDLIWWITNLPSLGGKSHSASNCRSNNLIRCFQNRLGSILAEISYRRTVEYPRVPGSHKHPGTQVSLLCPEVVREGSDQQGDLSENRQFDWSSISEQQGRDPLPSVTAANIGDMELVRDKTPLCTSSTCSGKEQCRCGRRIAQN